jgi:DnaK suppressor protein
MGVTDLIMPETERSTEAPEAPADAIEPEKTATAEPADAVEATGSNPGTEPAKAAGTKSAAAKKSAPKRAKDPHKAEFLAEQRTLLLQERDSYTKQADELKAEADSLALEHEPGDVQFDEEGGEGGTSNVDRELDLLLSAQARGAVLEIDRALVKIDAGNYGTCEQCGQPIPQARLKALPYAALCVGCKSGGLSRR